MAAITSVGVSAPGIATNHFVNETCTGEKTGPCVETTLGCVPIKDSAGAHRHVRKILRKLANYFDPTGNGHGDFRYRDPSVIQGLSGVKGVVARFHADAGKDPDFFNESANLISIHTVSLTSLGV